MTRIKSNTKKYRLLADGTIIEQTTQRYCGFIWGIVLDEVWNMHFKSRQKWLRNYVEKDDKK